MSLETDFSSIIGPRVRGVLLSETMGILFGCGCLDDRFLLSLDLTHYLLPVLLIINIKILINVVIPDVLDGNSEDMIQQPKNFL